MNRLLPMVGLLLVVTAHPAGQSARTPEEQVIAIALNTAIGERAIPDFDLAVQEGHLVLRDSAAVATEPVTMLAIREELLPSVDGLKIDRLPMPKIRDKAEHGPAFVYLTVLKLEVHGSEAFATVSAGWMVGKNRKQNYVPPGASGIRLRMVRQEGAWKLDKIVERWTS